MQVTLAWHEAIMAAGIGILRHVSALKKNLPDRYGCTGGWQVHIEGACGELALAKFLDRYWDGSVDTFSRGDVGEIQVRTRSEDWHDLIVREKDRDEDIFVLVCGKAPKYTVKGWITGRDAKQDQWRKTHGGRDEAWFVPQRELRKMEELR